MSEPTLVELLRPRALRWLAQREQSEAELRRKLLRVACTWVKRSSAQASDDTPPTPACELYGAIDAVVQWLQERHYLSNQRFIDSRVRSAQGRWGTQRIEYELSKHGLRLSPPERQELAASELSHARSVWERKFGPQRPTDPFARAAQVRFLMRRGFAMGVIRQVFNLDPADEHFDPQGNPDEC